MHDPASQVVLETLLVLRERGPTWKAVQACQISQFRSQLSHQVGSHKFVQAGTTSMSAACCCSSLEHSGCELGKLRGYSLPGATLVDSPGS